MSGPVPFAEPMGRGRFPASLKGYPNLIRPLLCVAALALAVSSVSQVIAASPRYALTQLRPVAIAAGTYASVYDINDSGLAVGEESRLNTSGLPLPIASANRGLAWTPGVDAAAVMSTPAGRVGTVALRVNNAGQIAGKAYQSSGAAAAAMLSGSSTTIIGSATTANTIDGINAQGDVVGFGSAGAFLIRDGVVSPLQLGSYANGLNVNGINDAGTIIGQPLSFSDGERALRLSTTAAPVAIVPGDAVATAINNAGTVAGYVRVGAGGLSAPAEAATFANGLSTRLGTLPKPAETRALGSLAYDLNDRGDVIGTSGPALGSQQEQTPFLFRDGQLIDLTSLVEGTLPAGFRPGAINNRGQIVGTVYVDHDNNASTPRLGVSYRLDPIRVAGDANVDGVTNFADLAILAASFEKSGKAYYETGDFNYDWRVDVADLKILAAAYATPNTLAADLGSLGLPLVPEPATLATLSLTALLIRRRRA